MDKETFYSILKYFIFLILSIFCWAYCLQTIHTDFLKPYFENIVNLNYYQSLGITLVVVYAKKLFSHNLLVDVTDDDIEFSWFVITPVIFWIVLKLILGIISFF